MGRHTLWSCI